MACREGVNFAEWTVEQLRPWKKKRGGVGHFSEWALLARIGGVNVSEALVIHWTSMSDAGIKSKTLALKDKYWSI